MGTQISSEPTRASRSRLDPACTHGGPSLLSIPSQAVFSISQWIRVLIGKLGRTDHLVSLNLAIMTFVPFYYKTLPNHTQLVEATNCPYSL